MTCFGQLNMRSDLSQCKIEASRASFLMVAVTLETHVKMVPLSTQMPPKQTTQSKAVLCSVSNVSKKDTLVVFLRH